VSRSVTPPTAYPPTPATYPAAPIVSRTPPFASPSKSRASSHEREPGRAHRGVRRSRIARSARRGSRVVATAPLARHLRVGRPSTLNVRRGARLVARARAGVALLTARPELESTLRSRARANSASCPRGRAGATPTAA
jgi:hypothetical protein